MTHNYLEKTLFSTAELWISSLQHRLTHNSQRLTTTQPILTLKIDFEKKNNHVV